MWGIDSCLPVYKVFIQNNVILNKGQSYVVCTYNELLNFKYIHIAFDSAIGARYLMNSFSVDCLLKTSINGDCPVFPTEFLEYNLSCFTMRVKDNKLIIANSYSYFNTSILDSGLTSTGIIKYLAMSN